MKPVRICTTTLICLFLFACATKPDVYKEMDAEVSKGDYNAAISEIATEDEEAQAGSEAKAKPAKKSKKTIYPEKNLVMRYVDKGLLEHYAKRYDQSSVDLQTGARLMEEAYTKSITETTASYLLNDNTKDYAGEDYENLYTNIFGALNYYHKGDLEGALVEVRQANEKLDRMEDKYSGEVKQGIGALRENITGDTGTRILNNIAFPQPVTKVFSNSALARYLGVLFYRADGDRDDARIDLVGLNKAWQDFPDVYGDAASLPASLRATGDTGDETAEELEIPAGKARINFIAFAGRGPTKVENKVDVIFPLPSVPDATISLPKLEETHSSIKGVSVSVNGETLKLDLLEDIYKVAAETFKAKYPAIYTKTFVRTLIKYTTAQAAGIAAGMAADNQSGGGLAGAALGFITARSAKLIMDATESADTRSVRYLPGKAYVGGITVDPGEYHIIVNYAGGDKFETTLYARENKLNLVETVCLK